MAATVDLLARRGYAAVRIEDVARAAGVNKTTVYRRWATRADLVTAALTRLAAPPRAADTGQLDTDLVETFVHATSLKTTPSGRSALRALLAAHGEPEVARVAASLRDRHRAPGREILQRARRRGDLPAHVPIELTLDVLLGAVYTRLRSTTLPPDRAWLEAVVRLVLAGAAQSGRAPSRKESRS